MRSSQITSWMTVLMVIAVGITVAFAVLVAGCGGGTEPSQPPIVGKVELDGQEQPQQVVESLPPPPAEPLPSPAEPLPSPAEPLPPPAEQWTKTWSEDWEAVMFGGWVRHSMLICRGPEDTEQQPERFFKSPGATWSTFGNRAFTVTSGRVLFDFDNNAGAILSWVTHDTNRPIRLSGEVQLNKAQGAWVGLTLIQDESDYREISLEWDGGTLHAALYAPCYAIRIADGLEPGPHRLALAYYPGKGWSYMVDGEEVHWEPIDRNRAALVGPPRVGIYSTTHPGQPGPAQGWVGALTVERMD